jgi:uncharacterized protein (TIGR04255 family)
LASVSQSQLSVAPEGLPVTLPGNLQAAVRHGAVPAGTGVPGVPPLAIEAPSYFLDVDVFTEGHQQFLSNQIIEQFHLFHSEINKFFFWSVTEEGGKHFGLSVDGD